MYQLGAVKTKHALQKTYLSRYAKSRVYMFRECEACIKKRSKFEDNCLLRDDSIVMARMGHSVEILRYSFILLHPDALLFSTVKAITPTMKIHQLHTDDKLSVPCICGQFFFFTWAASQ